MKPYLSYFTDSTEAWDYGVMREAVRIAAIAGRNLSASEWPKERINAAAIGRGRFRRWYDPVADKFDALAHEISEKMEKADKGTLRRLRELAECGDEMHDFYSKELQAERIPHLPPHIGDKYPNVLRAWETLRKRMPSLSAVRAP